MNIKNVIVVFKRTSFELFEERNPRIVRTHIQHRKGLDQITSDLKQLGISYEMVDRMNIPVLKDCDLVITVGGDGTLLRASHFIKGVPILGVNSSPRTSVGRLCATTTKKFKATLRAIVKDKIKTTELQRISLSINGRNISEHALNDVLICDNSPARIVRYRFRLRGKSEEHRCSGIWIATPGGSTAAIHSAGGRPQAIGSKRLQFLVREPYFIEKKDYKFLKGFVEPKECIKIESHMREGRIYIDGADVIYKLKLGDKVGVCLSKEPLYVFGL